MSKYNNRKNNRKTVDNEVHKTKSKAKSLFAFPPSVPITAFLVTNLNENLSKRGFQAGKKMSEV